MKKINSYSKVVNKDIGIRINANESYKNISDYELRDMRFSNQQRIRHHK